MSTRAPVALVTGAASGIGKATAHRLGSRGYRVAVADVDLDAAQEVAAQLPDAFAMYVDVTNRQTVSAMVDGIVDETGSVDVLVNNAGLDHIAPFLETDEKLWERLLAVNLMGQIACCHAVLGHMVAGNGGNIVCVSSDAGRVGSSGEVVYSAAKGGVIAFAKGLAREMARHNVRVNVVAPGPTRTPFLDRFAETGRMAIVDAMVKATPLRRLAEPDDIAGAIAFFASPDAGFVTGQTLSVSGGLTMA
jgi:2-hydroxycyclohexanecarboxyl-CoA dehydrogenase